MSTTNEIVLRPRFKIELEQNNESVLQDFENKKKTQSEFIISRVDDHVFIKFPKKDQHFWSPQLHVEVEKDEKGGTLIKGLYGPKPQIWSLFIFMHFGVALAFIVFLVLAYTRWSLEQDYSFALMMCFIMPLLWFVLYFLGRLGRKKGAEQIHQIDAFLKKVLNT